MLRGKIARLGTGALKTHNEMIGWDIVSKQRHRHFNQERTCMLTMCRTPTLFTRKHIKILLRK